MLLSDFRTRVSGEIGLSNIAASSEQALIDGWTNDAIVQFLVETKCYVLPFAANLTAGTDSYNLDASILALKDPYIISANGTIAPMLQPMSAYEIMYRKRFPTAGWEAIGYTMQGANLMVFSTQAQAGDQLAGLYVPRPTVMSSASNDPSTATYGGIPLEFHETLVQYPLWKASIWDDDFGSAMTGTRRFVMIGEAYHDAWTQGIQDAKIKLNKKTGVRMAPARRKFSRRIVPTSPGVDVGYYGADGW